MSLKVKSKSVANSPEKEMNRTNTVLDEASAVRYEKLMAEELRIEGEIAKLNEELGQVKKSMLEVLIAPFKFGQTVMYNRDRGCSRGWMKGVIENGGDVVLFYPYKVDGSGISQRHFLVYVSPKDDINNIFANEGEEPDVTW